MGSVLVVEDDVDLAALLSTIVQGYGHRVRIAPNGVVALARVAEEMPDLILLDIKMPLMGGQEFAARFRDQYGRAAPLVVMTAADSAALRAQEIDAEDWFAKPFAPQELSRVLTKWLSTRRST